MSKQNEEPVNPLLSGPEPNGQVVPKDWNDTLRDFPRDRCVHQLFEEQVQQNPDAVAVVFEDSSLTYGELNFQANQLACHLRTLEVGPNVLVGLCVDRSLNMIVALIGILKAGGAYLPLDPGHPKKKLQQLLRRAELQWVLTTRLYADTLREVVSGPEDQQGPIVTRVAVLENLIHAGPDAGSAVTAFGDQQPVTASHAAYLNFTSGSTGEPQGVLIPHRAVVRLVKSVDYVSLTPDQTLLHMATLSFDASTFEIWGALLNGARLVLMPPGQPSLSEIGNTIRKQHVTTMWLTAGLFHLMVDERIDDLRPLQQLLAGGDVLSPDHVIRARQALPHCRLVNGYGPTENTTFTCCYTVNNNHPSSDSVPIGRPISNTTVFLLDRFLQPVAVGAVGELYTGGDGVALGYLNREDLTAEKFIAHPFSDDPAARLYRTGDLCRYLPDGNIEFIGRLDQQVKIRGFRIELGEIETALRSLPVIRDAAVLAVDDSVGGKQLVSYLIPKKLPTPEDTPANARTDVQNSSSLRDQLSLTLPEYMIPSKFVLVPEFPLTANGKLNRKALQTIVGAELGTRHDYVAPKGKLEKQIAAVWEAVLQKPAVGVLDNFFELGGHSLLAVVVCSRVAQETGMESPLHFLFQHPTIRGLAQQLEQTLEASLPISAMVRHSPDQPMHASFGQQRMWLVQQLLPDSATYNCPFAWRVSGALDRGRLRHCLQVLMHRHEQLRVSFVESDPDLMQVVNQASDVLLPWQDIDLQDSLSDQTTYLDTPIQQQVRRSFELAQAPLWRVACMAISSTEHVLVLTFHHSIIDEWSVRLLCEELQQLYATDGAVDETALPALAVQYPDYAEWERTQLNVRNQKSMRAYWRKQLQDASHDLTLPTDFPRPQLPTGRGAVQEFPLPSAHVQQLKELAEQEGTTLFTVLLTAFHVWLQRYTGQNDLVVGTPVTRRTRSELEGVLGFFLNTLPVRAQFAEETTFCDAVSQLHQTLIDAYQHADLPFEQIVEVADQARNTTLQPLYQAMFVMLDDTTPAMQLGDVKASPIFVTTETCKNDLGLNVFPRDNHWICQWEYATDLFRTETIKRMNGHFLQLLTSVVEEPKQDIRRLELMSAAERQLVLVEWNDTSQNYPLHLCLHELFEEQVLRTPDAVAVVFDGCTLTYRELNRRANQLACMLKAHGVGENRLVILVLDRSIEMVVAIYATLKAGGAYLPIEPETPADRIAYMFGDAQAKAVVTRTAFRSMLPKTAPAVVCLDEDHTKLSSMTIENLPCENDSSSLAYVIYTSGSTGRPKGVMNTHRSIVNRLLWMQDEYQLGATDVVVQKTPYTFDVSVWEFFWPLLNGSQLVVAQAGGHRNSSYLAELINTHKITTIHFVPSMLHVFVRDEFATKCQSLTRVICSGEVFPEPLQNDFFRLFPDAALYNLYGPTEAAIDVTSWHCRPGFPGKSVPIGKPIANTRLYILESNFEAVATGAVGELFIGGDGVALGYLNREDLTAEKFIADPFSDDPAARLYRTGDLCRYLPDGNIEFIGRVDQQVKIRGFRIELGEVETALRSLPFIRDAAVLAVDDSVGGKQLVSYLIPMELPTPEGTPANAWTDVQNSSSLRDQLSLTLPEYMIPSKYVIVSEFPLTANGKLNRKALQTIVGAELGTRHDYVAPKSKLEKQIAAVWEAVLQRPAVGVLDNFFELGGHSLLAVVVCSRVAQETGLESPLHLLFQHPTIRGLAQQLEQTLEASLPISAMVRHSPEQPMHASFGQQRMWLVQQLLPDSATYNCPFAWRVSGALDRGRLRHCLQVLMHRHEQLRVSFVESDPDLMQVVNPASDVPLPWQDIDLQDSLSDQTTCLDSPIQQQVRRTFELAQAPLWRVACMAISSTEHVLVLTFHHSIIDEWSVRLLCEELQQLYATDGAVDETALPALAVQYADFAGWERKQLNVQNQKLMRAYWRKQLQDASHDLTLPTDFPRPQQPTGRGASQEFPLPSAQIQQLKELAEQEGTTLFTVLLTAFHVWLQRYTGQNDVVVGTPVTRRTRTELEGVLGFFLNTLPVRAQFESKDRFCDVVSRQHKTLIDAYQHADLPFEQIVEVADQAKNTTLQPLHQAMFMMLDDTTPAMQLGDVKASPIFVTTGTCKNDLTLSLFPRDNQWICQWEYATDLFRTETIERMNGHFLQLLTSVVASPEQDIRRLELMSAAERQQVLVEWNDTSRDYPRDRCVHELFEEQVHRTPDAVAVVFENSSLTYAELNAQANQLACHLQTLGVGPNVLVGLCVDRSLNMIVALIGILKAGGAYLPLDPGHPKKKLQQLLRRAELQWVLTTRLYADTLREVVSDPEDQQDPIVTRVAVLENLIHVGPDAGSAVTADGDRQPVTAEHAAYLNFTSGSTGEPQGVLIPHRAVVRLVKSVDYVSLTPDQTLLHMATLSFDASTFEIWGALLNGARLVLMPPGQPSLSEIGNTIRKQHVTTMWLTAGLFHLMVDERIDDLRPLQQLLAGGDVLSPDHVIRARKALPNCRLINGYGPTENTTFTCCYTVNDNRASSDSVPIGRPISNTTVFLLDRFLQPVAVGAVGELYTGGDGVALGYLNREDLTAEKFIADPFSDDPAARLYRTGDLCRHLLDGNIEFIGRLDQQVKIRGFRIELGEVETALRSVPVVRDAVVLQVGESNDGMRLVAYVIPLPPAIHNTDSVQSDVPSAAYFRDRLSQIVPEYMVPSKYVLVAAFPLTPNGKLDRDSLLESALGGHTPSAAEFDQPGTLLEEQLTQMWRQILQEDHILRSDNFFELGGHSLLAAKLVSEIEHQLGCRLSIADLFQAPTVTSLSQRISNKDWTPRWSSMVPMQTRGSKHPLFCIHGWGGSPLGFTNLASELGPGRPVYGLQAVGIDGRSQRHTSVEEMARHYTTEIRSVQPCGPYHVVGHSLGGWIAYAVAQELTRQGETVAFLGLLDTQFSSNVGWPLFLKTFWPGFKRQSMFHLRQAWQMPMNRRYRYLASRLKWLRMHLPGTRRELPGINNNVISSPHPESGRIIDYFDAVATMYRPQSYTGDVYVFAGEDQNHFPHERFWKHFVNGKVNFFPVAGDHDSLISQKNCRKFAVLLEDLLDAATGAV